MRRLFNLSDISKSPQSTLQSDLSVVKLARLYEHKVAAIKELSGAMPSKNEAFFLWTINQFNAFSFIPYFINQTGRLDEVVISTYSINIKIIDSLSAFIKNNQLSSLYILISDSVNYRIPKVVDHLNAFCNIFSQVTVKYAWNHSKVTLVKTMNDHFVIEGSGNFSENSRHEQYVLLNSEQVYNFRKKWITDEIHGRST